MTRSWTRTTAAALLVCVCVLTSAFLSLPAHAASHCSNATEVYYLADGADYRGHVSVTETGLPCQKWSTQYPNPHEIALDPASGIGDHNYCRNPNGLERPGCFTDTPNGGYQFCNVGAVCPDYPTAKATILFSPKGGSTMVQDGSDNYVSLSCYPRPCNVYYTLGAETIASAASTPYTQPILLTSSTTVKAYAVFQNAEPMRVQAAFAITPTTTVAPPQPIQFVPTDTVVYDQPILVMLSGVSPHDRVLMYWNDDIMHPTSYNGSFWLKNSTSLLAIVNGTYTVSANYVLNVTAPALYVYPSSGQYVGGVSVLVRDPQPPASYYMYVNHSAEWEPLSDLLFSWTTVGTSVLDVRALHVHGLESRQQVVYEVVAADPPTILPDPSQVYHRPVNVTCATPIGVLVPLSIYRDAAMQDAVVEDVYAHVLSSPGSFTVTCSYVDDLSDIHTSTAVVRMVAVPMQSPTFRPECGTKFPAIPLSLEAKLDLSLLLPNAAASSWSVRGAATGGASIPMITRSTEDEGSFMYDLFPGVVGTAPTRVTVSMTAQSTDALEADSRTATCAYTLYPRGTAATPFFSARPACATTAAPVSEACMTSTRQYLASCLNFYSTELLDMTALGPFLMMRMTGLAEAIRPDMYVRMGWCLAALQTQQVLSELHNETSGKLVMATSWHVATPTRKAAHVFAGLPVTVHVEGFHALANTYHMVRGPYSCEDIGVIPEAVLAGSPYATSPSDAADGSAYITFRVPVAGPYKLCAYVADALYTVPFSASPSGVLSEAWAPTIHKYLDVQAQSWPAVATIPEETCGGLVPPAMENAAFTVSMATSPAGAFSTFSYSYDNGGWATATLPVDAATQLTGAVPVKVGPLSRTGRTVQVLDATMGPSVGAAQTCVFFVSASAAAAPAANITYLFYTVNTTAVPAGSTGVMLLLQGSFQPSELIVVDVYEVVSSAVPTTASSLQLIRRVTARASAGTGYTVALPDSLLGLTAGAQPVPFVIYATLDGVQTTATPSAVALSPLSLAMTSCTTCASGLCYNGECLCKNKRTKVMHVCDSTDVDSSSDDGVTPITSSTTTTTTASPSSDSNGDDDVKPASVGERLGFLLVYLGLLGAIAAYILISIRRGGARRERAAQAEEITVEPA